MTKPVTEANKVAKQIGKTSYKESIGVIAASITDLATAVRELSASKLKRRAVLVLLRDMTNIGMSDIETVLNAAARIDQEYLKP